MHGLTYEQIHVLAMTPVVVFAVIVILYLMCLPEE